MSSTIRNLNPCISLPESILFSGKNVAGWLVVSIKASKHALYVVENSTKSTIVAVVIVWSIGEKTGCLAGRWITERYRILEVKSIKSWFPPTVSMKVLTAIRFKINKNDTCIPINIIFIS
jgi:hypothetical protein